MIVWRSQRESEAQEMEVTKEGVEQIEGGKERRNGPWSDENTSSKGKSNVAFGEEVSTERTERSSAFALVHWSNAV